METCEHCGGELESKAVLCVRCGYHRKLQKVMPRATVETSNYTQENSLEQTRDESENPFAAPVQQEQSRIESELDDVSAAQARIVADGALPVFVSLLLTPCVCLPVMPFLLPLYCYRLLRWWQMRSRYPQLRQPNSLSPYAEIEISFGEAGVRYMVSVVCGFVSILPLIPFWLFVILEQW